MLLFRSEEHLNRWLLRRGLQRGAVLTLHETWELAKAWYVDRRQPHWRARHPAESEAVLRGLGLESDFWAMPVAP